MGGHGPLARQFPCEHHRHGPRLRPHAAPVLAGMVVAARMIRSSDGGSGMGESKPWTIPLLSHCLIQLAL